MQTSTLPQAQSTSPAISLATLRAVLAKGQAAHPELAARMQRAATIVALRRIQPGQGAGWWVQSEEGDGEYWVFQDGSGWRDDRCTCADYRHRGGPCKHAVAVRLLQACERAEARGASLPAPVPADSAEDRAELTAQGAAYLQGYDDGQAGRPWVAHTQPALEQAYQTGYQDGRIAAQQPSPAA